MLHNYKNYAHRLNNKRFGLFFTGDPFHSANSPPLINWTNRWSTFQIARRIKLRFQAAAWM